VPTQDQDDKALEYATDVRKFEIGLFWTRSLFFWGFITTALAAYGASIHYGGSREMQFGAGCFGLVSSIAWALTNRSSKYWQKIWETKVEEFQQSAVGRDMFSARSNTQINERWLTGPVHYSVSKLTIALSDFVVLCWCGLVFRASPAAHQLNHGWILPGILVVTVIFVVRMLCGCRPDPV